MKIAYIPFAGDNQLRDEVQGLVDNFHAGKWFREEFDKRIRIHDGPTKVLADVSTSQELYLFCHGRAEADEVACYSGTRLSVAALAAQIHADGLQLGHTTLKLYACHGGSGGNNSTAYRLWQALFNLKPHGYRAIGVYGYTVSLITEIGQSVETTGARNKRAANEHEVRKGDRIPFFIRPSEARVKFGG